MLLCGAQSRKLASARTPLSLRPVSRRSNSTTVWFLRSAEKNLRVIGGVCRKREKNGRKRTEGRRRTEDEGDEKFEDKKADKGMQRERVSACACEKRERERERERERWKR
jgi:hypothetical protein